MSLSLNRPALYLTRLSEGLGSRIKKMADIYQNALFNTAVEESLDDSAGIFRGVREKRNLSNIFLCLAIARSDV
jgi:hypothetical protein